MIKIRTLPKAWEGCTTRRSKTFTPAMRKAAPPAYPVEGVWNPASPSQSDILYQVCQASTCN